MALRLLLVCGLVGGLWMSPVAAPHVARAQEEAPPESATDDAASADDAAPAEASVPLDEAAAQAAAEFQRVFADWKTMLGELRELQLNYKIAEPSERATIREQFDEVVARGEALQPQVIAAAEAYYAAAPNHDEDVGRFLLALAMQSVSEDRYDDAERLAEMLADHEFPNPQVYEIAATAAFVLSDYDAAEKYFALAAEHNSLSPEGRSYQEAISAYRELWAREQQLREAQAETNPQVLIQTNRGDIKVELFEEEAPNTVANFISLIEKGFYNDLTFHRVLHGFMAQGGCPLGTGTGGPGYHIPCESYEENHRDHFRGSLSMAHAGRDTGGSQFFLTYRPTPHLNGRHTVFGRVIEGFDVLADLRQRDPSQADAALPDADRIVKIEILRKTEGRDYSPETLPER